MNKDNSKVPVAVLSCFLIAFILQGSLKLGGILVFEKALDWQIFSIIDNCKWLQVIYYSLISLIAVYCLSFALTAKPYSNKWYHYVLMILIVAGITAFRIYGKYSTQQNLLMDIILYIALPFTINITSDSKNRIFDKLNIFNIAIILTINIALYYCYLGITYWSNITASLLPLTTVWVGSSTMFLINFEIYIGLIVFMISMNILISKFKEKYYMNMPVNIASKKAKLEIKRDLLQKKIDKINAQISELKEKDNA